MASSGHSEPRTGPPGGQAQEQKEALRPEEELRRPCGAADKRGRPFDTPVGMNSGTWRE